MFALKEFEQGLSVRLPWVSISLFPAQQRSLVEFKGTVDGNFGKE